MRFRRKSSIIYGEFLVLFVFISLAGCGGSKPTVTSNPSLAAQQTVAAILTQTAAPALTQTPAPASTQGPPQATPNSPQVEQSSGVTQEPLRSVVMETPSGKTTVEAYHDPTFEPTQK